MERFDKDGNRPLTQFGQGLNLICPFLMQWTCCIRISYSVIVLMVHTRSLKIFCDIVSKRSFSRAATDNGISQSGASQAVSHLEEHLGVKLLDRSKRPFVLTPEGDAYYHGCHKLLKEYYALEEEVRSLHEEVDGRVNVASIFSVGLSYMNEFVQLFKERNPFAAVHLEYQHPSRVYELVKNDQADVGLVSYPRQTRQFHVIPWREERMVVVCAPVHRFAEQGSVALADLSGESIVGFNDHLQIRRETDKVLSTRGIHVDVAMEFDNIETLKRAIEVNAGIGVLPEPTIVREIELGTLVAVRMEDIELVRPVGIIHRHGSTLGPVARRFIEMLRSHEASSCTEAMRTNVVGSK